MPLDPTIFFQGGANQYTDYNHARAQQMSLDQAAQDMQTRKIQQDQERIKLQNDQLVLRQRQRAEQVDNDFNGAIGRAWTADSALQSPRTVTPVQAPAPAPASKPGVPADADKPISINASLGPNVTSSSVAIPGGASDTLYDIDMLGNSVPDAAAGSPDATGQAVQPRDVAASVDATAPANQPAPAATPTPAPITPSATQPVADQDQRVTGIPWVNRVYNEMRTVHPVAAEAFKNHWREEENKIRLGTANMDEAELKASAARHEVLASKMSSWFEMTPSTEHTSKWPAFLTQQVQAGNLKPSEVPELLGYGGSGDFDKNFPAIVNGLQTYSTVLKNKNEKSQIDDRTATRLHLEAETKKLNDNAATDKAKRDLDLQEAQRRFNGNVLGAAARKGQQAYSQAWNKLPEEQRAPFTDPATIGTYDAAKVSEAADLAGMTEGQRAAHMDRQAAAEARQEQNATANGFREIMLGMERQRLGRENSQDAAARRQAQSEAQKVQNEETNLYPVVSQLRAQLQLAKNGQGFYALDEKGHRPAIAVTMTPGTSQSAAALESMQTAYDSGVDKLKELITQKYNLVTPHGATFSVPLDQALANIDRGRLTTAQQDQEKKQQQGQAGQGKTTPPPATTPPPPAATPAPPATGAGKPVFMNPNTPNPADLVKPGNIDLTKLKAIRNPDGTWSTVHSISFEDEKPGSPTFGQEVVVRGILNNVTLPDNPSPKQMQQLRDQYAKDGLTLGVFKKGAYKSAGDYGTQLHNDWAAGKIAGVAMEGNASAPAKTAPSAPLNQKPAAAPAAKGQGQIKELMPDGVTIGVFENEEQRDKFFKQFNLHRIAKK